MSTINRKLRSAGFAKLSTPQFRPEFGEDYCDVEFQLESEEGPVSFTVYITYATDEDDKVYIDTELDEYGDRIASHFIDEYAEIGVQASTKVTLRRVVAAEGDEDYGDSGFGEEEFGAPIDDDLEENVDDLADNVEDVQDLFDDVEEDDVNLEIDANIANHYIVQCDGCHDIFISALAESDQIIEKVSGVCPICEKDTDQYVKFIVRELEFGEDV